MPASVVMPFWKDVFTTVAMTVSDSAKSVKTSPCSFQVSRYWAFMNTLAADLAVGEAGHLGHDVLGPGAESMSNQRQGFPKTIAQVTHLRDAMAAVADRYVTVQQDSRPSWTAGDYDISVNARVCPTASASPV